MPLNIPSSLGAGRPMGNMPRNIGKIGVPTNIGRAQTVNIGQTQQRKDVANSRVSMNQIMSAKAEATGQRTTSIRRLGVGGTTAQTSVTRYQTNIKTSANTASAYNQNVNSHDEKTEENRHNYTQQLIKRRKEKERQILIKRLKEM